MAGHSILKEGNLAAVVGDGRTFSGTRPGKGQGSAHIVGNGCRAGGTVVRKCRDSAAVVEDARIIGRARPEEGQSAVIENIAGDAAAAVQVQGALRDRGAAGIGISTGQRQGAGAG